MKKIISLVLASTLFGFSSIFSQSAAKSPSPLKTGVWAGTCSSYGTSLKLNIDSVTDGHVKGQLNFVDFGNAIVQVEGEIASSFGDFVEQSHWQFVAKDKKFRDGTWIKLKEISCVQGKWELKTVYYGFLKDDVLAGCFYYGTETEPHGRFELRPQQQ